MRVNYLFADNAVGNANAPTYADYLRASGMKAIKLNGWKSYKWCVKMSSMQKVVDFLRMNYSVSNFEIFERNYDSRNSLNNDDVKK